MNEIPAGSPKPSFVRRLFRPGPRPDETPDTRIENVAGGVLAVGVIPLGVFVLLETVNIAGHVLHGTHPYDCSLLLIPGLPAPLWGFCIWVGVALKRRRPWARKAGAFLCASDIAALAGAFICVWILISPIFLFMFARTAVTSPSLPTPIVPWYVPYGMFGFILLATGYFSADIGIRLFRTVPDLGRGPAHLRRGRPGNRIGLRKAGGREVMERVMGIEPTTATLARWRSTAELHPRKRL